MSAFKPSDARDWAWVGERWPEATVYWDIQDGSAWGALLHEGPWPLVSWDGRERLIVVGTYRKEGFTGYTAAWWHDDEKKWVFQKPGVSINLHMALMDHPSKFTHLLDEWHPDDQPKSIR